jgi:hypothetical protein
MNVKTERRTQLRKRPLSLVYVELPPSNGGMMRDLSEHGFSLRAMIPLQPSEKIPFSFALDTAARIDGEAIVRRLEDGGRVAALEFAGLPSHSRDQIRRWLDKVDEPISPGSGPGQPVTSEHSSLTELRTQIRAPKPALSAPPAVENAPPPPPKELVPPRLEPPAELDSPKLEITPLLPPMIAASPNPEPPPPAVPPVVESPELPRLETAAAPPVPEPPPPQRMWPLSPPPTSHPTFEQPESSPLPPLLKLSSVRPGPLPAEISAQPAFPVAIPTPALEPPAKIQVSLPTIETPTAAEKRIPAPVLAPPVIPRHVPPPALEPLSSFEAETDSDTPGWMDRFTLGRAIGIMLFLSLLAGSYVYHRELGQALIWLGQEIGGEDSPESSKAARPEIPRVAHAIPESSPAVRTVPPPPLTNQPSNPSIEPRGENLPPASDKTPSPQLKDATPGSLVPLTQVTRPPVPAPPADNSAETGQQEYLQALQILRAPSRATELPEAIRLLWVAVEKGNTSAEIDLAELYWQGRGAAKNCAQTRILLSAAARRGNAEARKRLDAFQREGCSE